MTNFVVVPTQSSSRSKIVLVFLLTAFSTAAWAQSSTSTLTVDDVVSLLDAKLPETVILARIKNHGKAFTLSTDDMLRLTKAGAGEKVMVQMMDPSAGTPTPAPVTQPQNGTPGLTKVTTSSGEALPFTDIGIYFKKGGEWMEMLPEVVNWKTGGILKNIASVGVVKKDVNGNIIGEHSRNSVTSPVETMIYAGEGVAITEYQLLRLRGKPGKGYREFRTVTGGVFHEKSGAMRDMVPFEGKKVGSRLYSVLLPATLGAGEYGFLHMGGAGSAGGRGALAMGKMYTFRLLE